MMCKLKGWIDNGGNYMEIKKVDVKGGNFMCKLRGWMDKGGHYDMQIKRWIEADRIRVAIMMLKYKGRMKNRCIMMCKLKGQIDKGGHYDFEKKDVDGKVEQYEVLIKRVDR